MLPPKGFKPSVETKRKPVTEDVQREGSLGREGGGRTLSEHPDQIVKAHVAQCEACGVSLSPNIQQLMPRYERIEIPPIRLVVTQIERCG